MKEKIINPFEGKRIRSCFCGASNKRLFSVVDIIAAVMGSDYQKARNYWKWLKRKLYLQGSPLAAAFKQLKFEALDGKLRYTDVMDAEEILQLIQVFPSPKAEAFKQWIAALVEEGAAVVECVEETFSKVKDEVKWRVGKYMQIVRRQKIDITVDLPVDLKDGCVRDAGDACPGILTAA